MKQTKLIMGMPITVEVIDQRVQQRDFEEVFSYFRKIDRQFSSFKSNSEVSKINCGEIPEKDYSLEMKEILTLSEKTKKETRGYFNVFHDRKFDPSGIVKGWTILQAAKLLDKKGFQNYYVDAGGDTQVKGRNKEGKNWTVGIRNPFNRNQIVKVVELKGGAIATSGTYIRGDHIYNPEGKSENLKRVVSLTVIGHSILDADRFATAAFAMGEGGINFIEKMPGLEAYQIDRNGLATMTSGFKNYLQNKK